MKRSPYWTKRQARLPCGRNALGLRHSQDGKSAVGTEPASNHRLERSGAVRLCRAATAFRSRGHDVACDWLFISGFGSALHVVVAGRHWRAVCRNRGWLDEHRWRPRRDAQSSCRRKNVDRIRLEFYIYCVWLSLFVRSAGLASRGREPPDVSGDQPSFVSSWIDDLTNGD